MIKLEHVKKSFGNQAILRDISLTVPTGSVTVILGPSGSGKTTLLRTINFLGKADGGTLFMDEIGDMSLAAQAKVLRALQESRISRVGSDRDIEVNVRVVAATNKNLREEIQKGNFREDLYHRLAVIVVRVPPLREHAGDIPALVEHFIRTIASEYGSAPKPIDADALAELQRMPWSGNIRELRNVIERLIILSGDRITARDVKEYC